MYKILSDRCRHSLAIGCIAILLAGLSCKGKTAEPSALVSKASATKQVLTVADSLSKLDYLRNFKTRQLGERKFVIQPGDTIDLPKPMLKLFMGEVEGKQVQFWLSTHKLTDDGSSFENGFEITAFTSGDTYIRHTLLQSNGATAYLGNTDGDEQAGYKIVFDLDTPNRLAIRYADATTTYLWESDVRFEATDRLKYKNIFCEQDSLSSSVWSYFFNFRMASSSIPFAISNSQLATAFDGLEGVDSKVRLAWKDTIQTDTELNPDYCDAVLVAFYEKNYTQPLYIDSLVFVVTNFKDAFAGGAHSMTYTHYANYDMQTGKKLKLTDLIDWHSQAFRSYYDKLVDRDFIADHFSADAVEDQVTPSSFFIIPSGICLQYAGYGLTGGFEEKQIFLPYDDIKPFLKTDKYFRK